eukprot:gnl/TRDRNA2_/TRDRNA2_203414_c0_seq1.p1 gnl/TRDRNA2_/TRDRNA2_203414_c0~~gnl/TRDRNA2_/TRDRNA2_203414_c0_seq1.p1  ORF type:complete len:285 (-),score=17.06 gnl/TRDRNA2_/TRDRNA2_203414_c0_seq1:105-959(-)
METKFGDDFRANAILANAFESSCTALRSRIPCFAFSWGILLLCALALLFVINMLIAFDTGWVHSSSIIKRLVYNTSLKPTFQNIHAGARPGTAIDLLAGFEEISTPEPYMFHDTTEGIAYMARWVNSENCLLESRQKEFWRPLQDLSRVTMTFGKLSDSDLPPIRLTNPTDVKIFEDITTLYYIALNGVGIHPRIRNTFRSLRLAWAPVAFGSIVRLLTFGEPPKFSEAALESPDTCAVQSACVNTSITCACYKDYYLMTDREHLGYHCQCVVKRFPAPFLPVG